MTLGRLISRYVVVTGLFLGPLGVHQDSEDTEPTPTPAPTQSPIVEPGVWKRLDATTIAIMEQQGRQQGVPEEEIETYRQKTEDMLQLEEDFLADLGIDQALFDRTQRDDKGMNDGQDYSLFLPSPETFERYGIAGVQGDHSEELIETLEQKLGPFARE